MQALSTAAPGKVYTIKWMFGLPEVLDIIRNCQIEVVGRVAAAAV